MIEGAKSFGERLRRHREAAGLSQEELAEKAGISGKAIGALERGERRRPYPATIRQLADALGLDETARSDLALAARPDGSATPTAATAPEMPNLPHYLTSLIGREGEMEVLQSLLRQPSVRLLTLTGPGGIGKTRLAVSLAMALSPDFPDGVFFVDLTPLTDPEQVPLAIAQAVGARESSAHDVLTNVAATLRDRRALLLLDNFEHVLEAASRISTLLVSCPRLWILATSRARLRLRGEQEYRVPPLALPHASSRDESPSVALFIERARSLEPNLALSPENVTAIERICARLDGLPLAIELAAARSSLLSPPALLTRLEAGLHLLGSGPRDLPERQRTLRDAIAWSHDLLSGPEQTLFRRLAVFVDGCGLDAVETVCGDDTADEADVLDAVMALLDGSMLVRQSDDEEPRIAMLGTIRAFAGEKLVQCGEAEEIARRHADFYAALAEMASPHLMGSEQLLWLERLRRDRHNLRAAVRFRLDRGDAGQVIAIGWALWRFLWLIGWQREARQWMREALAQPDTQAPLSSLQRAQALLVIGSMAWSEGDGLVAVEALREALDLSRDAGSRTEQAVAGMMLGLALLIVDPEDLDGPQSCFEESLRLFRERNSSWGEAFVVGYLGLIPLLRGELDRAARAFEESLRISRQASDDRVPLHQAHYSLGLVAQLRGQHEVAERHFSDGLQLAHALGDLVNAGYFIKGLGQTAGVLGHHERAARLLGAAEAALEGTGSPPYRYLWNRALDEQVVSAARIALGSHDFETAWHSSRAMGLERATGEALS